MKTIHEEILLIDKQMIGLLKELSTIQKDNRTSFPIFWINLYKAYSINKKIKKLNKQQRLLIIEFDKLLSKL